MNKIDIIGRAERVDLPDLDLRGVPAKIDTGADSSAIWVSRIDQLENGLNCYFFEPGSRFYTGVPLFFPSSQYTLTRVANSFGQKENRYKVQLRIRLKKRLMKATFTLADRADKVYPILLGRRLLRAKFLVDVSAGRPLYGAEKERAKRLQAELANGRKTEV